VCGRQSVYADRRRIIRRAVVAALVLAGHVALLWLLSLQPHAPWPESSESFVSVLLDLAAVQPPVPAQTLPPAVTPPPNPSLNSVQRVAPATPAESATAAITAPGRAPNNYVDWVKARQDAARRMAAALAGPKPRGFGKVEPSRPFRICRRPRKHFEWDPDIDKPMLEKLLPTFKVGKRCTVMPPFFGCVLGDLPPPNGKLLDDMRDPDRSTSSVPSDADCVPDDVMPP
jgi:hypothetical protein